MEAVKGSVYRRRGPKGAEWMHRAWHAQGFFEPGCETWLLPITAHTATRPTVRSVRIVAEAALLRCARDRRLPRACELSDDERKTHRPTSLLIVWQESGVALPESGATLARQMLLSTLADRLDATTSQGRWMEKFDRAANSQHATQRRFFGLACQHSQIPAGAAFTFRSVASPRMRARVRCHPVNFAKPCRAGISFAPTLQCAVPACHSSTFAVVPKTPRCTAVAEGKRSAAKRFASFIFFLGDPRRSSGRENEKKGGNSSSFFALVDAFSRCSAVQRGCICQPFAPAADGASLTWAQVPPSACPKVRPDAFKGFRPPLRSNPSGHFQRVCPKSSGTAAELATVGIVIQELLDPQRCAVASPPPPAQPLSPAWQHQHQHHTSATPGRHRPLLPEAAPQSTTEPAVQQLSRGCHQSDLAFFSRSLGHFERAIDRSLIKTPSPPLILPTRS
ncbi:hypothetical protein L1887_59782 [Cichorium endivia]|nr:hypothetical protein L1887_59782 [Cichorium endivia]